MLNNFLFVYFPTNGRENTELIIDYLEVHRAPQLQWRRGRGRRPLRRSEEDSYPVHCWVEEHEKVVEKVRTKRDSSKTIPRRVIGTLRHSKRLNSDKRFCVFFLYDSLSWTNSHWLLTWLQLRHKGASTSGQKPEVIRRELVMHNKAPMWNESSQVYQLDFGGRVTQESAKNFQIEFRGKQVDDLFLFFSLNKSILFLFMKLFTGHAVWEDRWECLYIGFPVPF